jgi:hypothetical protein
MGKKSFQRLFKWPLYLPLKWRLLVSLKHYQTIPPQYDVIPEKLKDKSHLKQYFIKLAVILLQYRNFHTK